jgi:NADPH-dependent curcumin reductase CurA
MSESPTKDTLAIVTGANGAVGNAYLQEFSRIPTVRSVGIVRKETTEKIPHVEYIGNVDLLKPSDVEQAIESIGCRDALKILLVHPVGKFKFEEAQSQNIDPDILLSNLGTLEHTIGPILKHMNRRASLVVCGFGSVSDKYDVPFWRS